MDAIRGVLAAILCPVGRDNPNCAYPVRSANFDVVE